MNDYSKRSPAPWQLDDGDGSQLGVFDSNGEEIAYLCEPRNLASETPTANARLIAVAPDLLAALKSILENSGERSIRDTARTAITKAEGT